MSEPINVRIARLRAAAGMTVTQLANAVGVTYSGAKKWEDNPNPGIHPDNLRALATVLGVTYDYLLDGKNATCAVATEPERPRASTTDLLVGLDSTDVEALRLFRTLRDRPDLRSQAIGYLQGLADIAAK